MHSHIFSGQLFRMQGKYTIHFTMFMTKNSKFLIRIIAYLDVFEFKGHIFLIIRVYFKFEVHI